MVAFAYRTRTRSSFNFITHQRFLISTSIMNRYLSLFAILFTEISYSSSTCSMSSKTLEESSSTYLRLKNERGHWHNQPRNSHIDDYNGERHQALTELQKQLGQPGTSADEIQRLMGPPTKVLDKPDLVLAHEFKRTDDNYSFPSDTKIWIYEWRNNHDYVYFLISKDNKVTRSDWYNAFE